MWPIRSVSKGFAGKDPASTRADGVQTRKPPPAAWRVITTKATPGLAWTMCGSGGQNNLNNSTLSAMMGTMPLSSIGTLALGQGYPLQGSKLFGLGLRSKAVWEAVPLEITQQPSVIWCFLTTHWTGRALNTQDNGGGVGKNTRWRWSGLADAALKHKPCPVASRPRSLSPIFGQPSSTYRWRAAASRGGISAAGELYCDEMEDVLAGLGARETSNTSSNSSAAPCCLSRWRLDTFFSKMSTRSTSYWTWSWSSSITKSLMQIGKKPVRFLVDTWPHKPMPRGMECGQEWRDR